MGKKYLICLAVLGAALLGVYVTRGWWRPADPIVVAAVAKLKTARPAAPVSPARPVPPIAPQTASVAPSGVLAKARARSSFLDSGAVAGLSDEQLALLESMLQNARRATYALLLERAVISPGKNGGVHIEIPAQGDGLKEMRDFVHETVGEIAGEDAMASLRPGFDAAFGHFGRYDTTIDLSFDGKNYPAGPPDHVTMLNRYDRMSILGGIGYMTATHVLRTPDFESWFFPLENVKPKR